MALDALLLPQVIAGISPGKFGALEGRLSHYGALNSYYKQAKELFDDETITKIRATEFDQTVKIPILNAYGHTVVTVRSCTISYPSLTPTLKTLTRVHIAISIGVIPAAFRGSYVSFQKALSFQYTMAKKAAYTYLDTLCAAHLDTNKDSTSVADGSYPLYTSSGGVYQLDGKHPEDFFNDLPAIMEEIDISGPYSVVGSTGMLADLNRLRNPGGGALFNTIGMLNGAGIADWEYTNRIARGSGNRVKYFVMPQGSVGIINLIDFDYQESPMIGSTEYFEQWDGAKNMSDINLWAKAPDDVYEGWEWGVLQRIDCADERKEYSTKQSADFIITSGFSSTSGESPIKEMDVLMAA